MTIFEFFRKYERPLYWFVVIFILPAMGITGTLLVVIGSQERPPYGTVFGEPISPERFESLRKQYQTIYNLGLMAHGGPLMNQPPYALEGRDDVDLVFRELALEKKADEAGILIPDREVAREAVTLMQAYRAFQVANQEVPRDERMRMFSISQRMQQELERIRAQDYPREMYVSDLEEASRRFGRGQVTSYEFEDALRRVLAAERLLRVVERGATVDPGEVWEAYQEKHHAREVELALFRPEDYAYEDVAEGPTAPPERLVRRYWENHPDRYRHPAQVRFRYLAADASAFEVDDPTEEELVAYRETHADRIAAALGEPSAPPLEEIRDWLVERIRVERREAAARAALGAARQELVEDPGMDLAAAADPPRVVHDEVGPVEPIAVQGISAIRSIVLQNVLSREPEGTITDVLGAELSVREHEGRDLFRGRQPGHLVLAQLLERTEAERIPLDEIRDEVRADLVGATDEEIDREYADHQQTRYRRPERLVVEVAWGELASFAESIDPTEEELATWYEDHRDEFDEEEGSDAAETEEGSEDAEGSDDAAEPNGEPSDDAAAEEGIPAAIRDEVLAAYRDERAREDLEEAIRAAKSDYREATTGREASEVDLEAHVLGRGLRFEEVGPAPVAEVTENRILDNDVMKARLEGGTDAVGRASTITQIDEPEGLAFYVVRRKIEASVPDLEEVRDEVRRNVLESKQRKWAEEAAQRVRGRALAGQTFAEAVEAAGREVRRTDWLRQPSGRGGGLSREDVPAFAELPEGIDFTAQVFSREVEQISEVVRATDDAAFCVWQVSRRAPAPADRWQEEQSTLRSEALREASSERARNWRDDVYLAAKRLLPEAEGASGAEDPGASADRLLREAHRLRFGAEGIDRFRVLELTVPADEEKLREVSLEAARTRVEEIRERIGADAELKAEREDRLNLAQARSSVFTDLARQLDEGSDRGASVELTNESSELWRAVADLGPGEISGPVRVHDPDGWALVKLESQAVDRIRVRQIRILADPQERGLGLDEVEPALEAVRDEARSILTRIREGETTLAEEVVARPGTPSSVLRPRLGPTLSRAIEVGPGLHGPFELDEDRAELLHVDEQVRSAQARTPSGQPQTQRLLAIRRIVVEGSAGADAMTQAGSVLDSIRDEASEQAATSDREDGNWLEEAFARWARLHSVVPSAEAGGAILRVTLNDRLQEAVFLGEDYRRTLSSLEVGEMSGLVTCPDGVRILLLLDRIERPYAEARADLASGILDMTGW